MKILITFFEIADAGGIINHHEQLCAGLRELGHEVTTKLLVWRDQEPKSMAGGRGTVGESGLEFDQRRGFSWLAKDIIPYKGPVNLDMWNSYASQFDLVIWQVAVPTKRKENRGNLDWLRLYDAPTKHIAIIHDGNFLDSYPWLHLVGSKLAGLACVHTCAYNSARSIDVPSAMIVNPFHLERPPEIGKEAYIKRQRGFLSVQTWKAWKRVPDTVRAMPHMETLDVKILAGKGIDYYYLTSEDKCKYPGIWDAALEAGMEYVDVITNEERDAMLSDVTVSLDASWSKKYAAIGAHFNRVQVEALLAGAVPVVRDLAVGHEPNDVFRDNHNCLTIPWDASPGEFGHMMNEYCRLPWNQYATLMENGWYTVQRFDRRTVAEQFLLLAKGVSTQCGHLADTVKLNGYKAIQEFFRG